MAVQGWYNVLKTEGGKTLKMTIYLMFWVIFLRKYVKFSKNWGGNYPPCPPFSTAPAL